MPEPIIMKTCRLCKEIKPITQFYKNAPSKDGHQGECKTCHNKIGSQYSKTIKGKIARYRAVKKYQKTSKGKISQQAGKNHFYARNPNQRKAQHAVNNAITAGKLPRPDTLRCHYGNHPAEQYHHWHGYEPEHWLDVVPVCRECHKHFNKKTA